MLKGRNDLRAFFIILTLCTLLLSSCGSSEEPSAGSKDMIDDPLIVESRETRAHLRESVEKAQQYLPDKDEDEQSSEVSVSSEEYVDEDGDLPSPSEDYTDDDSYANAEAGSDSNTDSNGNVSSDYIAAENSVITSNANSSSGFGTPDTISTTATQQKQNGNQSIDDTSSYTSAEYGFDLYNNPDQQNTDDAYVLNTETYKIHLPSCKDVPRIKTTNYATSNLSIEELKRQGYEPCGHCNP